MRKSAFLLKQLADHSAAAIKLPPGTFLVGRDLTCDIVLPHPSVSRRHAEIVVDGLSVRIRDLNSRNGTLVDDRRIEDCSVIPGQQLSFGGVSFSLSAMGTNDHALDADLETKSMDDAQESFVKTSATLPLSDAQRRVFILLLEGLAEKQISIRLAVSRHTVHNHVRAIYRKLMVHSRSELLAKFLPLQDDH